MHQYYFSKNDSDAVHSCSKDSFTIFGCSEDDSAINILEWQANYAAACFLMPQEDVSQAFIKRFAFKGLSSETARNEALGECSYFYVGEAI
ncbi:ImmA/IrrE family metallo-endopeptidase [Hallerella succinigenes]|uniref:ImmA/IrrE family metallo-endopeptidase n=1 Tax=Hallerella succinigenes TaxID=1896222 RepID=UPI0012FDA941|nr:hypothetical protein [Hallerella succinigenes]